MLSGTPACSVLAWNASESVARFRRNHRLKCIVIAGWFASEYARDFGGGTGSRRGRERWGGGSAGGGHRGRATGGAGSRSAGDRLGGVPEPETHRCDHHALASGPCECLRDTWRMGISRGATLVPNDELDGA